MAESLKDFTEKTEKRRKVNYSVSDKELEWQVYDLFGYGGLTVEVVEYLMALLVKSEAELVVLFGRLHEFYLDWCDGKFIEATEETLPQRKARELQQWHIESGQRRVDIYTGLNVIILLFQLRRYGQSQEQLRFYPCGQHGSKKFEDIKLLKIIGYSQCLGVAPFVAIVGKFLSGADLSGADLSGAELSGAELSRAKLRGAYLSGADLSGAELSRADLSDAKLSHAKLSGAYLSGANLSGADLRGAYLSHANLRGAELSRADLSRAYLSHANLRGAYLRGADLSRAYLRGAYLSHAKLRGAKLRGADLSGADLSGAKLSHANLSDADLIGAKLRGADLSDADLSHAKLRGADLRGADLSGADLSGADLSGADLSHIGWNSQTKWSNTIGLHEAIEVPEGLQQDPEFAAAVAQSEAASQQQQ
jgi:uncharacterized protein YjbI with pentapeptide repeats